MMSLTVFFPDGKTLVPTFDHCYYCKSMAINNEMPWIFTSLTRCNPWHQPENLQGFLKKGTKHDQLPKNKKDERSFGNESY